MVIKSVQVQAFEVTASECEKSKKKDLYLGPEECRSLFKIVVYRGAKLIWAEMTNSLLINCDYGHLNKVTITPSLQKATFCSSMRYTSAHFLK